MGYLSLLLVAVLGCCAVSEANDSSYRRDVGKALASFNELRDLIDVRRYTQYMQATGRIGTEEELTAVFNLMDKTKDGILEELEYVNGHLHYLEFVSLDSDGNKHLNAHELIKTMDADSSNTISFIEYYGRINTGYKLHSDWKNKLGTDFFSAGGAGGAGAGGAGGAGAGGAGGA